MRGVYSMAALSELESQGLGGAFDVVMGSSAGAINGAYFLARQAAAAVRVYTHEIGSRSRSDFRRALDIDFLVDVALKKRLPIDEETLLASESELRVAVTDALTGAAHFLSTRDPYFNTYEIFRATAAIPVIYRRKVEIGGREYVDGALSDAIPVEEAISLGAGLVVSVLTRLPEYRQRARGKAVKASINFLARGHSSAVRNLLSEESTKLDSALRLLRAGSPASHGVQLHTIWPSDAKILVGIGNNDQDRLLACAELGRLDMRAALSDPIGQITL